MIYSLIIALVVTAGCILYPPASQAQTTRPIRVTVDTLRMNVCGDKTFSIGVNVSPILRSDSVFGIQTVIYWDRSKFDIDSRILDAGTLAEQGQINTQKDQSSGTILVQIGNTNPEGMLVGSGPLFYLVGRVTAPDTVEPPDGWITVQQIELTGTTRFQPSYSPGFVEVVRDTTAAYTGRISATDAGFDTLGLDTVNIVLENVRARRVREVSFSIQGDTSAFDLVGILEEGTLAGNDLWSSKEITVEADSVGARLVARSDLGTEGILLKIVLRRRTDSSFSRPLRITGFDVGRQTCLGRLAQQGVEVTASSIIRDSVPQTGAVRDDRQRRGDRMSVTADPDGGRVMVSAGDFVIRRAEVFDLMGRPAGVARIEPAGSAEVLVRFDRPLPSGRFVIALHGIDQIVCKQFIIIK